MTCAVCKTEIDPQKNRLAYVDGGVLGQGFKMADKRIPNLNETVSLVVCPKCGIVQKVGEAPRRS